MDPVMIDIRQAWVAHFPPSFSLFATVKGETPESASRSEALPPVMPVVSSGGEVRQP
jgi:hypothetical protein